MVPRSKRHQTTALGRTVHWIAWAIIVVIAPVVYVLLQPHYGLVRAMLAALGCFTVGWGLDLLVIGQRAYVREIFALRRDRSGNLRAAAGCGVFTLVGVWAFADTHELKMLFVVIVAGAGTACGLYLAKTSDR